jgi:hypothetical protein
MLMEDISRNKCSFQVRILHALCFISIWDLFTVSPSYCECIRCRKTEITFTNGKNGFINLNETRKMLRTS